MPGPMTAARLSGDREGETLKTDWRFALRVEHGTRVAGEALLLLHGETGRGGLSGAASRIGLSLEDGGSAVGLTLNRRGGCPVPTRLAFCLALPDVLSGRRFRPAAFSPKA